MAVIKLHNTLSGEKEEFKPIVPGKVGIYSCGPTVYDQIHIGNLRAFIFPDVLRRMLEMNGYAVTFVRNITDVDDKTIKRSLNEKVPLGELTKKYGDLYFSDLVKINVLKDTFSPRATDHIEEMVTLINTLLEKGLAYKAKDGIYFSIAKSKDYGKLAGLNPAEISLKERISNDEYDKESPQDFALWKFWSEEDGEAFWETSLPKGRPGWHIECSAMSATYLGETFDIHTGGIDLIFPHHTNEIAQSEGATGNPLAHYWLHNGHILVDGKKMAKSANNFYTLNDVIAKGISPLAFRYWLLTAHYKTLVNFTWDGLEGAETALNKIIYHLKEYSKNPDAAAAHTLEPAYLEKFLGFINTDLDTPRAIALLWELIRDEQVTPGTKLVTILTFDKTLGLDLAVQVASALIEVDIPEEIQILVTEREEARKNKDFKKSDELREQISALGFDIKDSESGPRLQAK